MTFSNITPDILKDVWGVYSYKPNPVLKNIDTFLDGVTLINEEKDRLEKRYDNAIETWKEEHLIKRYFMPNKIIINSGIFPAIRSKYYNLSIEEENNNCKLSSGLCNKSIFDESGISVVTDRPHTSTEGIEFGMRAKIDVQPNSR